jgi:hypothetical protein
MSKLKLEIYYNLLYTNWYVGEFYKKFAEHLEKDERIDVEIKNIFELGGQYGYKNDYNNGLPSIFSAYNLIIRNKENGKTFIHSWHDYAPAMMSEGSGIELFNVVKFACVSRLDKKELEIHSKKYNVQPSIYLLENWDEHNFMELNRLNDKVNNQVYFNGLCYGIRDTYRNLLKNSPNFHFKNKQGNEYQTKENYYKELSQYKYGLNLDGAAKICYRDLEYFGMGVLLLREFLDIEMYEPLLPNVHYINFFTDDIKQKIDDKNNWDDLVKDIEVKIDDIRNNVDVNQIINNAREWFERNCLPENQIKIFDSFLEDFQIFKNEEELKFNLKQEIQELKKLIELTNNKILEIEQKI